MSICLPPPLSLFLYFTMNRCKRKKRVCEKKCDVTYQRVRKVKIKTAASKADKTQNQYKAGSNQQELSLWSITSQLIQITRHPQTQTADVKVHPKTRMKASQLKTRKSIICDDILAIINVIYVFCSFNITFSMLQWNTSNDRLLLVKKKNVGKELGSVH